MSKHANLSLEKERLRLKIKQQEYEIKKSFLDVQRRFDPLQLGLNFVSDWLSGDNELDELAETVADMPNPALQKAVAEAGLRRNKRRQQTRRAADILTNLYLALRNFLQMTFGDENTDTEPTPKKQQKKNNPKTPPDEYNEEDIYMVGRDDI